MKKMVCHGDSLTEAADLAKNDTWPILVEDKLNLKTINSGIGGDTSGGLLGRFYADVVRHQPDLVVILGGTNDLWWDLEVNQIQANIFAMACQARFHNITPIVGLPIPLLMKNIQHQEMMAPIAGWQKCVQKLSDLVAALKISAGQSDIVCLDFYHPFLDKNGNPLEKYYLADGLHPNQQGHRLMAEIAVDLLSNPFHFNHK
jgi:lysophospholipase L1-like esterase